MANLLHRVVSALLQTSRTNAIGIGANSLHVMSLNVAIEIDVSVHDDVVHGVTHAASKMGMRSEVSIVSCHCRIDGDPKNGSSLGQRIQCVIDRGSR